MWSIWVWCDLVLLLFDFVRLYARYRSCSVVCLLFQVAQKGRLIAKWVLKMGITIKKRHFLIFSDNCTRKNMKPQRRRYNSEASAKWKKSKESETRLMGWYWKRKPIWRKGLITYNSHPWIMFSFNWLVIIWRVVFHLKLDVQGQRGKKNLDVDGQGGWGVLKIGQFWWTSYVYHPLTKC